MVAWTLHFLTYDHPAAPKLMNRSYWKSTNAAEPMEHLQQVLEGFELGGADLAPIDGR